MECRSGGARSEKKRGTEVGSGLLIGGRWLERAVACPPQPQAPVRRESASVCLAVGGASLCYALPTAASLRFASCFSSLSIHLPVPPQACGLRWSGTPPISATLLDVAH
ncbi:hypothetical protein ACSS6W_002908 [Trichoderma asperelloides]